MKAITLAMVVFGASTLWADCPEGSYTTTEADRKFLADAVAKVKAALPAAPDGWRLEDKNATPYVPRTSFCKGMEKQPLLEGYRVQYVWVNGQKDLAQKIADIDRKLDELRRMPMPPDQEKMMNELHTKDRDLRYQARKADAAEAARLKVEAAGYYKQAEAIRRTFLDSMQPAMNALEAEKDALRKSIRTEVNLSVLVNGTALPIENTKPAAAQAGSDVTRAGADRVVLGYGGPWKEAAGLINAAYPRGGNVQRVYGIIVEAEGDAKHAEMLLARIDSAGLKSLLAR